MSQSDDERSLAVGITACIVCRNEADKLRPCLESLHWVDEIILMDLQSTDLSRDIAREFDARVIEREQVPIVEMVRNEVASHASHDWILVIDPDERISLSLGRELRQASHRQELDAVIMPRMNYDLGYPPSHPLQRYEPQLRMYRASRVTWPVVPNALPAVPDDRVYRIPSEDVLVLVHDRSRTISEVLDRSIRYAPLQAQSMLDAGEVFTARGMFYSLGSTAYKQFVVARAWRDGVPGVLRVGILVGFKFYVWAAFWQISGGKRTLEDDHFVRRTGVVAEIARYSLSAMTILLRIVTHVRRIPGRLSQAKP